MSAVFDLEPEALFLMALAVFAVHLLDRQQSCASLDKTVSTSGYAHKAARLARRR